MHIKEIRLQTAIPADLSFFYKDILQMNISSVDETLQILTQHSKLIFEKTKNDHQPFYHFAFNIPSNKITEAFEWIDKKVTLLWIEDYNDYIANFSHWNAKSVYFLDPAGNIVEFISRFDLKDDSNEPFSAALIRSVSEIGLVFPTGQFEKEVDQILVDFSLKYFSKQEPLPEFKAIGNDHGLFICVPENRNWFPTKNKPARIFPVEIIFTSGNKEFCLKK